MVTFNSGPHGAATTELSAFDQMATEMGLARLKVNPRGSRGMGDEVLQAIVGNVGEVRQEINGRDTGYMHEVIQSFPTLTIWR